MFCQNKAVLPLSLMPNGVMPTVKCGVSTYLYYREDGDLYFYDANIKTEFNLFHLTCRTATTPGIIPTDNLYFGIANQPITPTNVKTLLSAYSYGNTSIAVTIFATPQSPRVDTIHIVVPAVKTFTITQNGINIKPAFTEIGSIIVDTVTCKLYSTSSNKFIDIDSTFIIGLTDYINVIVPEPILPTTTILYVGITTIDMTADNIQYGVSPFTFIGQTPRGFSYSDGTGYFYILVPSNKSFTVIKDNIDITSSMIDLNTMVVRSGVFYKVYKNLTTPVDVSSIIYVNVTN